MIYSYYLLFNHSKLPFVEFYFLPVLYISSHLAVTKNYQISCYYLNVTEEETEINQS